jgi:hypothetical protein
VRSGLILEIAICAQSVKSEIGTGETSRLSPVSLATGPARELLNLVVFISSLIVLRFDKETDAKNLERRFYGIAFVYCKTDQSYEH